MAITTYTLSTAGANGANISMTQDFDFSVDGNYQGIVELQRSFDAGATFKTCQIFMSPTEGDVRVNRTALYRFITDANFTGSVVCIAANNV